MADEDINLDELSPDERIRVLEARARRRLEEQGREAQLRPLRAFGDNVATGVAQQVGLPVDAVNAMLSIADDELQIPSDQEGITELMNSIGVPADDETEGAIEGAGAGLAGAAVAFPAMLYPALRANRGYKTNINDKTGRPVEVRPHRAPRGATRPPPTTRAGKVGAAMKFLGDVIANFGDETVAGFRRRPGRTTVNELVGGTVGGAAAGYAAEQGYSPATQMLAAMSTGSMVAAQPIAAANVLRRAWKWKQRNLFPFTQAGGTMRGSGEMQGRLGNNQKLIDEADAAIANKPAGISAARATGDLELMALEAKVAQIDRDVGRQIEEDLYNTIQATQGELRDLYNTPKGRQEWEQVVMERVSVPGGEITPGTTEEMLDQAYDSFKPAYDQFRDIPMRLKIVDPKRKTELRTLLENSVSTGTVLADDAARTKVLRYLDNQMTTLENAVNKDGFVTFGDIQHMRSNIRDARRAALSGKNQDTEAADLLDHALDRLDLVIKSQLDGNDLKLLNSIDQQYGNYKVVENAVWRGRDLGLTPNNLLAEMRGAGSRGAYARGETFTDLRPLAHSGRDIAEVMNDPTKAARLYGQLDDAGRENARNSYVHNLIARSTKDMPDEMGNDVIDPNGFLGNLRRTRATARALGFTPDDTAKLERLGRTLQRMRAPTPAASERLMTDGPADIMELLAAWMGSQQGQRMASGTGSALVMAQFFSKKARQRLENLTNAHAQRILIEAHKPGNEALYRALLVGPKSPVRVQEEAVNTIRSYLPVGAGIAAQDEPQRKRTPEEIRRMIEEVE